ncbi:unnamed protein product [Ilex paraguariensis]|uniref:Uncharacterized protein n=1 Tax=Ilex paraguariensis TaxID=185542 RepID=A0ABC8R2V1_9AQUA
MKSVYLIVWFPGGSSSGIKGQPSWSNPLCDSHSRNACAYELGKLGIRQGSCVEIPKCHRWNIIEEELRFLREKAEHLNLNNAAQLNGGNINLGEGKMGNDINSLMGLAGFHGNGANNGNLSGMGGGGFQVQANNDFHGTAVVSAGIPNGGLALYSKTHRNPHST